MPVWEPTGEGRPSPSPEPRHAWPPPLATWLREARSEVTAPEAALVVIAEALLSKRAIGGSLLYPRLRGGHTEMP